VYLCTIEFVNDTHDYKCAHVIVRAFLFTGVDYWLSRMTASRTESLQPPPGRRRSNTTQSIFRNPPLDPLPLKVDDSRVLNSWVHDPKESATVIFNQAYWPGVAEGDMLRVTGTHSDSGSGFLFEVPQDDGCAKPQLQVHGNSRGILPWFLKRIGRYPFRSQLPTLSVSGIMGKSL
jgi:hypothetical protein